MRNYARWNYRRRWVNVAKIMMRVNGMRGVCDRAFAIVQHVFAMRNTSHRLFIIFVIFFA